MNISFKRVYANVDHYSDSGSVPDPTVTPEVKPYTKISIIKPESKKILKPLLILALVGIIASVLVEMIAMWPVRTMITNITSRSATISWVTKSKTPGYVIVQDGDSAISLPIRLTKIGAKLAYDDRDYSNAELEAAAETMSNIDSSEGAVYAEDIQTEVQVTDAGRYYTHHVTVSNLDPESSYNFYVGDGLIFLKSKSYNTESTKFTTFVEPENLPFPVPAYGLATDVSNASTTDTSVRVSDAIMYVTIIEDLSGVKSLPVSSSFNADGGWYIDLSNARSEDGSNFLEQFEGEQVDLRYEMSLEGAKLGRWVQSTDSNKIAPAPAMFIGYEEAKNIDENITDEKDIMKFDGQTISNNIIIDSINKISGEAVARNTCVTSATPDGKDGGKGVGSCVPYNFCGLCLEACDDGGYAETDTCKGECDDKFLSRGCAATDSDGDGEEEVVEQQTGFGSGRAVADTEDEDLSACSGYNGNFQEGSCSKVKGGKECFIPNGSQLLSGDYNSTTYSKEAPYCCDGIMKESACAVVVCGGEGQEACNDVACNGDLVICDGVCKTNCGEEEANSCVALADDNPLGGDGEARYEDNDGNLCCDSDNEYDQDKDECKKIETTNICVKKDESDSNDAYIYEKFSYYITQEGCEDGYSELIKNIGITFGSEGSYYSYTCTGLNKNGYVSDLKSIDCSQTIKKLCYTIDNSNLSTDSTYDIKVEYKTTCSSSIIEVSTNNNLTLPEDFTTTTFFNCGNKLNKYISEKSLTFEELIIKYFEGSFKFSDYCPDDAPPLLPKEDSLCVEGQVATFTVRNRSVIYCTDKDGKILYVSTSGDKWAISSINNNDFKCVVGHSCSMVFDNVGCLSSTGVFLDCNHKGLFGPLEWTNEVSNTEGVTYVSSEEYVEIEKGQICNDNKCKCGNTFIVKDLWCPETNGCQGDPNAPYVKYGSSFSGDQYGKVCDNTGKTCINVQKEPNGYFFTKCEGPVKPVEQSNSVQKINNNVLAQEQTNTEYIFDTNSGTISGLSSGVYTFNNQGVDYMFYIEPEQSLNGKVLIYIDSNGNGTYDESGDIKITDQAVILTIKQESKTYTYTLSSGFNMITFPFVLNEYPMASTLIKTINESTNDSVYSIAKYDGSWKIVGDNGNIYDNNDFQIVPGQGYIIKAKNDANFVLTGNEVQYESSSDTAPINLIEGWNLVGLYGSGVKTYTAESMIDDINSFEEIDFEAVNVSRYPVEKQRYEGLQKEKDETGTYQVYGFDFPIEEQEAYFVRIIQGRGNWQPGLGD